MDVFNGVLYKSINFNLLIFFYIILYFQNEADINGTCNFLTELTKTFKKKLSRINKNEKSKKISKSTEIS